MPDGGGSQRQSPIPDTVCPFSPAPADRAQRDRDTTGTAVPGRTFRPQAAAFALPASGVPAQLEARSKRMPQTLQRLSGAQETSVQTACSVMGRGVPYGK